MIGTRKGQRRPESGRDRVLADPDVRRWYEDLQRGSKATGDVYVRRLWAFCQSVGKSPADLARLSEPDAHRLLLDFVSAEERRGATGSFVSHSVTVVRSWLTFNGKPMVRRIKIRRADATPTLDNERTPTPEELHRILLAAPTQWRTAAALVAHAGVRLEVLGNYVGNDGLRVRDLPDLEVRKVEIRFTRTPAMVVVRPELSKAGHRYFTFLGAETAGYITDYLSERAQAGEVIGPDTDVIHPARASKRFVRTINIGDGIRAALRKAGFPWRPYVLRAYFDTQLLLAESKGMLAHDYRAFWMGHKGSMEARYTTNKGRLPQSLVDDMREAYGRCDKFLTGQGPSERDVRLEVARVLLESLGYTEKDLEGVDLSDVAEVRALTQKRVAAPPARQRLVGIDELPGFLEQGWSFVGNIGADRVLLNPPDAFRPGQTREGPPHPN